MKKLMNDTNYASKVVREIHADRKARRAALATRGLRDEITAMTWENIQGRLTATYAIK